MRAWNRVGNHVGTQQEPSVEQSRLRFRCWNKLFIQYMCPIFLFLSVLYNLAILIFIQQESIPARNQFRCGIYLTVEGSIPKNRLPEAISFLEYHHLRLAHAPCAIYNNYCRIVNFAKQKNTVQGITNLTFFKKIKNTDPLMGAKLNRRHIYLIRFLIFGAVFCAFGFKV